MKKTILLSLLCLITTLTVAFPAQAEWSWIQKDSDGSQWYLESSSVETDHHYDHNHHTGYVRKISPNGTTTYFTLGVDCQSRQIRQFSDDRITLYKVPLGSTMAVITDKICRYPSRMDN